MTASVLRTANPGFAWVVGASAVAHALAFVGVLAYLDWTYRVPNIRDAIPVELVQLGAPRDPKLLPRKVRPPPPPPPSTPAVAGDAPPVEDAVALEKPQKPAATETKEPQLSDAARRLLDASDQRLDDALAKIETPEGAPNGFARGTTTDPSARGDAYQAAVRARLQDSYSLPETISRAERPFLEATVRIQIDGTGKIIRHAFVERHPNLQFMNALERMLEAVELPAPPADQAAELRTRGLVVVFKPTN